jgi:transglutaminase-like putative cysteine protease
MSLWRDELKPAPGTLVSLVALAAVVVASLGRVIQAPGYVGWAIAALAVGAVFALYFGRRSLGLGFGLLLAFGILTLPALFLRGGEASLLPTPSAFRSVRALVQGAFDAIPKSTPPVPAQPRYVVLVWCALLLLGFLCAAWVVVRRPVGAIVSLIAVVTFTGSVGEGPGRDLLAVAAVAATGAFFLSEGRHRIARWGGGRVSIPAWLGLPTLVIACAVALGAPIVLGDTPIVKLQSAIRPRVVIIKPLSDIRRQLKVDPPLEVMRVQSDRPTYWRLTALDAYDGSEWVLEARPRDILGEGQEKGAKLAIREAEPPTTGETLDQTYRLTSLLSPWAPAAYAATLIETEAAVQLDEPSQTLLLRDDTKPGLTYSVRSRLPKVTTNEPGDLDPSEDPLATPFLAKARQIVGDAQTPLDIARRLEDHFQTYTYDEDVPGGHGVDRLQKFLADKRGYCEQFAATMTLMLRAVGVPARVGVGFLPGGLQGAEYIVSTRDAHAWVEADIPGAGWFTFDPTPGRADASSIPPESEDVPSEPEEVPQVTAIPEPTPQQDELPDDVLEEPSFASRFPIEAVYALLAMMAIGSIPTAKTLRRRRRARGSPDEMVIGAYSELVDRARDLGHRPRATETVREFVSRVLHDDNAVLFASLSSRAFYGPGKSEPEHATQAWSSLANAQTAMRKGAPRWRRMTAVFDPRTFLPEGWARRPLRRLRSVRSLAG